MVVSCKHVNSYGLQRRTVIVYNHLVYINFSKHGNKHIRHSRHFFNFIISSYLSICLFPTLYVISGVFQQKCKK